MKTYIGISRDHSGSMRSISKYAARDYNANINAIKEGSEIGNQDTIVSVVKCGIGCPAQNLREVTNSSVNKLQSLDESAYITDGNATPLFDSVGMLIDQLSATPDANDVDVSFLIMAVTDGGDNASVNYSARSLGEKIKKLQNTDRWTFIFRVPPGESRTLISMGIPEGNIQEWDANAAALERSTKVTTQAFKNYFTDRAAGKTATRSFYTTNLSEVTKKEVRESLDDITKKAKFFKVSNNEDGVQIRDFIETHTGKKMVKGSGFYQLTKTETVQDYKIIAIRDISNKKVYAGDNARQLLGLPYNGDVKVKPGDHGKFEIFIQSTSVNRKLFTGTELMFCEGL